MTNDELNYWLCLWYHIRILGKCVHENTIAKDHLIVCKDCNHEWYRDIYADMPLPPPDYLSDPAVIWDIIKQRKINIVWDHVNGIYCASAPSYTYPLGEQMKTYYGSDIEPERAVMLALKAKVENE